MKRIPDIIITVGVILGILGISTNHRIFGASSMLIAFLVGWKRNWCMWTVEEMLGSAESSETADQPDVSVAEAVDTADSSSADSD
jgi:hypothetical protein